MRNSAFEIPDQIRHNEPAQRQTIVLKTRIGTRKGYTILAVKQRAEERLCFRLNKNHVSERPVSFYAVTPYNYLAKISKGNKLNRLMNLNAKLSGI